MLGLAALQRVWTLLREVLCGGRVSLSRLQADLTGLRPLDAWPLLPLVSGRLCPVSDRFVVFTPPTRSVPSPSGDEGQSKHVETVAPEASEPALPGLGHSDEQTPLLDSFEAYPASPARDGDATASVGRPCCRSQRLSATWGA